MFGITGDMLGGFVRAIAAPAITWAVAKNYIDVGSGAGLVAAASALATAAWSAYTNRPAKVVAVPGTGPAIATGTIPPK